MIRDLGRTGDILGAMLSGSFPTNPYELSGSNLSTPTGNTYHIFVPEADGSFAAGTIVEGVVSTFTKGIPVFAVFTKIVIAEGGAGKAYKRGS